METKMKDSGIPWIGMIPSDWEVEPIGRNIHEVDNPNVGGTETNALQFKAGTIISKSVGDSKYHPTTLEAYNVVDEGVIMLNGLNLSFDLISQRVGLVQEKGVITSAYLAIKPNERIKSEFLTYLFKAYDARKALHAMGKGLRQTLAWKELKCYSVVYPPLPTQQRIADFLDRKCAEIDELAALQETMIAELKRYKQSLITEAVTKGLDPNVPMKDSGVECVGEIPSHWNMVLVPFVFYNLDYLREPISTEKRERKNPQYDYYGASGIIDKIDYYNVEDKVLLIGEDGANLRMRNLPLIYKAEGRFWVNNHAHILKPKKDDYDFMSYMLEALDYSDFITGSAQPKLSQENLSKVKVCVPPLTEQRAISDYLDRKCAEIDELIAIKQQKIEALKEYKKSVIFEYVTGKKEVGE